MFGRLIGTDAIRVRNVQLFGRGTMLDNERTIDCDLGFVTYDDDGHYAVTSFHYGFRSDHFNQLVRKDDKLSVDSPEGRDDELIVDPDRTGHVTIVRDDDGNVVQRNADERKAHKESERKDTAKRSADDKAEQEAVVTERKAAQDLDPNETTDEVID